MTMGTKAKATVGKQMQTNNNGNKNKCKSNRPRPSKNHCNHCHGNDYCNNGNKMKK